MTPEQIADERAKRPAINYTITLPEGEYAELLQVVLYADVSDGPGLGLATKDAIVKASRGRGTTPTGAAS